MGESPSPRRVTGHVNRLKASVYPLMERLSTMYLGTSLLWPQRRSYYTYRIVLEQYVG